MQRVIEAFLYRDMYYNPMTYILCRLIYFIFWSFNVTYRYRYLAVENVHKAQSMGNGAYILSSWHQNFFQAIFAQKNKKYAAMASRSKDAEPMAYTCTTRGNIIIRGSSSRGGVNKGGSEAKAQMIEVLKSGIPGAVTVDGPVGPAKIAKPGIIKMASEANVPVSPYLPLAESYWEFNSWDKFRFPKPFSRIIIYYVPPLEIPSDLDAQQVQELVDQFNQAMIDGEEYVRGQFVNWKTLSKENDY